MTAKLALAVAAALAAAAPAALATAAPAAAQTPLEVRGVRAENAASGGVTITFTARAATLYRRIAGRRTIVRCQAVNGTGAVLLPLDRADELFEETTAPRKRRSLRIRGSGRYDVCELTVLRRGERRRLRTVLSLALPVTTAGEAYLEARRLGNRMVAVVLLTAPLGRAGAYPAAETVAADVPRLVVLAAPGDSPPPGRVGLYSDAARHVTVVAVTTAGVRLFIDADGGVVTTNVPQAVLAPR